MIKVIHCNHKATHSKWKIFNFIPKGNAKCDRHRMRLNFLSWK